MPNRMERFTQRARRVLRLAQEAAASTNSPVIGTEHLLLGLMREDGGMAGRVLRGLGLELPRLEEMAKQLPRREESAASAQLDLSPGTKTTLEFAVDEARRLNHHAIGSEHLLLGLLRLDDSVAVDMLRRLGVAPEQIRQQVAVALNEDATSTDTPEHPRWLKRQSRRRYDYFLLRTSSRAGVGINQLPVALSDEVNEALEEALAEMGSAGRLLLEERQLLLGLLRNRAGAFARLLTDAEVDLEDFIRQLRDPRDA